MAKKLTRREIETLAKEIRQFLLDHGMWQDVRIYFNGKAFATDDGNNHYAYNDPEQLFVLEDEDPRRYFEYVGTVLSMSFEGPFYELMNGYLGSVGYRLEEEFQKLLWKYGTWYELGNAWNLAVYYL